MPAAHLSPGEPIKEQRIGKPALASAGEKRSPPPPGKTDVNRGNMPGLQSTFLAMDTEEGVEVVGNELHAMLLLAQQEKIKAPFEQLVGVDHPNIVKVHKYWLDMKGSKAQVISITDYVSSGSLKQFLKKTKKNHKAMSARVGEVAEELSPPIGLALPTCFGSRSPNCLGWWVQDKTTFLLWPTPSRIFSLWRCGRPPPSWPSRAALALAVGPGP
uniref:Nuclear receptor binding protein 2 n=1 Tax=Pseudonaja textilis TaxID=8673 RepID=A0A670ZUH3_PSETE